MADQTVFAGEFFIAKGRVEQAAREIGPQGPADLHRLDRSPAGGATGYLVDDVAQGQTKGNAFNWRYTLALPVDGSILNVQMDDWMYLMNDRVMLNKARMTKLGVHLGDVTLSFTKRT
jgi:hypothetical protein